MPFNRYSKRLAAILLIFISSDIRGQVSVRDSVFGFSSAAISGGYFSPGGDLADRFGNNFSIGGKYIRKTKGNWIWGFQGDFLFGDNVKETSMLNGLVTSQGQFITQDGTYGTLLLYERGWKVESQLGKLFPLIGPNKNSGIVFIAGAGFIQHKIRIESQGYRIPYLEGDYTKGYDRLTNGWYVSQFLGYMNFGNRRRVNFFIGIEAVQAFTKNRRSFNFDTRSSDDSERSDRLLGLKAGWIIPLYKKVPNAYYFD